MEPYFQSLQRLEEDLLSVGLEFEVATLRNESLITRGRNVLTSMFLSSQYDRLLFIDSDIEFSSEDVAKLWNQDWDVGVGAYSMKRPDKPVSAWVGGKLVELKELKGPCPVDYAGTGFMMIKKEVFETLKSHEKIEEYEEGRVGQCWSFFMDPIEDGIHLSEDYFFCKRAREMGLKVMLDPSISLGHWGSYRYGD